MSEKRRGFRFGMKSLLLVVTVLCLVLATIAQPMAEQRRQRALLDQVAALGGRISTISSTARERSLGRFLLASFDAAYDRYYLYRIDFSKTKLTDSDLQHLARIRYITELDLSNTQITDAAIRHLRTLESLRALDLSGTAITDRGVAQLSGISGLVSLQVAGTQVSYGALEQLDAELPYANFCEQKAITDLKATGVQVVDLTRWVEMPDGSTVRVGHEAVEVVVGMKGTMVPFAAQDVLHLSHLRSLREATFHSVTLASEGLSALRPLPNLKSLDFWFTNLSDTDLESLGLQTQLESLGIYEAEGFTDAGLMHLKTLTNLKRLHVMSCVGITKEGLQALYDELPNFSPSSAQR